MLLDVLDERIAELIGRHLGDGSLVKHPKTNGYRIILTEEERLLQDHAETVKKYFQVKSIRIKPRKSTSDLIIYSKELYNYITYVLKISLNKKSTTNIIPTMFFKHPLNIRKYIVRGFMDTDGSLYYSKKQKCWIVELNIIHKDAIDFVSNVLE